MTRPSVAHPVAIVLGSGLGHLAGHVKPVRRIDYHDIPDFPSSATPVKGHSFEATVGTIQGTPVVVYPGRVHLYQGYSPREVTSLVRHAQLVGCRTIVLACAAGAVPGVAECGLGVVSDHINLTGHNPLVGQAPPLWPRRPASAELGVTSVDMGAAYDARLRDLAREVARDAGIVLGEGVLAGVLGPSFETPAEVAALGMLGVSYVSMSCVCETIMARALGMSVLAIVLATNVAGDPGFSHQDVLTAARAQADPFRRLVKGILARM